MIEVLETSIVDGAPASRDTLDQLYDVLNAAKANLASPILTGNPRSVTPATADDDTSIATTAYVKSQGRAPIASPVLTGNPRAPTPSTSDDDTNIATTGFVQNVRDALQTTIEGGAANSRDTLQELYTLLNATKANIASPTFTTAPHAPRHHQQGTIRRE